MNALNEQFVAEVRELIQQASDELIAAEHEGFSEERIDRVFRVFHTLKGSAAVVDLPAMGLGHACRRGYVVGNSGGAAWRDVAGDRSRAGLPRSGGGLGGRVRSTRSLAGGVGGSARELAEGLRSLIKASTRPAGPTDPLERDEAPDWVTSLLALPDVPTPEPGSRLIAFCYEPASGCFFDGDDPLDVVRRVPGLRMFRVEAREAQPPLADLDPYSCNLRLRGVCVATHAELAAVFRLLPDQVRISDIPNHAGPMVPDGTSADDATALTRAVLEEQILVLRASGDRESDGGRFGSAMRAAVGALRHASRKDLAESVGRAGAEALSQPGAGGIGRGDR